MVIYTKSAVFTEVCTVFAGIATAFANISATATQLAGVTPAENRFYTRATHSTAFGAKLIRSTF